MLGRHKNVKDLINGSWDMSKTKIQGFFNRYPLYIVSGHWYWLGATTDVKPEMIPGV